MRLRDRPDGTEGGDGAARGRAAERGPERRCGMRREREAGRAKAARKRAAGRPASRRVRARSGSPGPERRPRCREGRAGPDRRPDSDRVAKRSLPSGIAKQDREGGKTVPDRGGDSERAPRAGWDRDADEADAGVNPRGRGGARDRPHAVCASGPTIGNCVSGAGAACAAANCLDGVYQRPRIALATRWPISRYCRGASAVLRTRPNGTRSVLPADTAVQLVGTDNVSWLKVLRSDGSAAWLHLDGNGYQLESPNGPVAGLSGLDMAG